MRVQLFASAAFALLAGACAKSSSTGSTGVTYPATVNFAGGSWKVKASSTPFGPGPNLFSADNVSVDAQGRLHLKIAQSGSSWTCAEAVSTQSFGYGTYVFYLSGASVLNENAVLGLFTWSDDPAYHDRELDVELSRWSDPSASLDAQFVVQPSAPERFASGLSAGTGTDVTARFTWSASSVAFQMYTGLAVTAGTGNTMIHSWTYTGSGIPVPGGENARINLWLNQGTAPSDGKPIEAVIQGFQFVP